MSVKNDSSCTCVPVGMKPQKRRMRLRKKMLNTSKQRPGVSAKKDIPKDARVSRKDWDADKPVNAKDSVVALSTKSVRKYKLLPICMFSESENFAF
jgi:hypothetical protein